MLGTPVWAATTFGESITGLLRPSPGGWRSAVRPSLAYTEPTEFVDLYSRKKLEAGPIFDMLVKHAERLGVPDVNFVRFEEIAHADIDRDGHLDSVVSASTERDRYRSIPEQAGDITALFLVVATADRPQIMDLIVVSAEAGGAPRTGHYLALLSMARNPKNGAWNFLVVEGIDRWREETYTRDVTIDGHKTQQTITRRLMDRHFDMSAYALENGTFKPLDGLRYGFGIAGET